MCLPDTCLKSRKMAAKPVVPKRAFSLSQSALEMEGNVAGSAQSYMT
jgi:hypothetical protein